MLRNAGRRDRTVPRQKTAESAGRAGAGLGDRHLAEILAAGNGGRGAHERDLPAEVQPRGADSVTVQLEQGVVERLPFPESTGVDRSSGRREEEGARSCVEARLPPPDGLRASPAGIGHAAGQAESFRDRADGRVEGAVGLA